MQVIGTAGHVDHGKSTLVRALTGIDPDRLAEEKARGMTIDLGFAWLRLPSGRHVSIVDVPGHERFIKNMLAGAGGIDIALLVVAADEGVMPQTREHLHILDLLGVERGVVAVTKSDMVESDWLELIVDETREYVRKTSLADAPLVPVSAVRGDGLTALLTTIDASVDGARPHTEQGSPRLPVDRVFTLAGHGTVVTGTLLDGPLAVGQDVEVQPHGLLSRVRSLQTHKQRVTTALPGSRVAVNLAGLATEDIRRGDVLTLPGASTPTHILDVRLRVLPDADIEVANDDDVALYVGAAEVNARVRLLDARTLGPGESAFAQLRLHEPVSVRLHDRFVIRRPSPSSTIGGGQVLDPIARHHRRFQTTVIKSLSAIEQGTTRELVRELLGSRRIWDIAVLAARCQLTTAAVESFLQEEESTHIQNDAIRALGPKAPTSRVMRFGSWVASGDGWQHIVDHVRRVLDAYHRDYPLRLGMPREELRSRTGLPARPWNDIVAMLITTGILRESRALLALAEFEPTLSGEQRARAEAIVSSLSLHPFAPPPLSELAISPDEAVFGHLIETGKVVKVAENMAFAAEPYNRMRSRIVEILHTKGSVTVATVRDEFGASRRYALALLEHLDAEKVTRRVGDERVLGSRGATTDSPP